MPEHPVSPRRPASSRAEPSPSRICVRVARTRLINRARGLSTFLSRRRACCSRKNLQVSPFAVGPRKSPSLSCCFITPCPVGSLARPLPPRGTSNAFHACTRVCVRRDVCTHVCGMHQHAWRGAYIRCTQPQKRSHGKRGVRLS